MFCIFSSSIKCETKLLEPTNHIDPQRVLSRFSHGIKCLQVVSKLGGKLMNAALVQAFRHGQIVANQGNARMLFALIREMCLKSVECCVVNLP